MKKIGKGHVKKALNNKIQNFNVNSTSKNSVCMKGSIFPQKDREDGLSTGTAQLKNGLM